MIIFLSNNFSQLIWSRVLISVDTIIMTFNRRFLSLIYNIILKNSEKQYMSFIYFRPNAFSYIQNFDICSSYTPQLNSLLTQYPQPYYQFTPWNQPVLNQNYSIVQQNFKINQFATTDSYQESQIIVQIQKEQKSFKKREKKSFEKEISSAKKNSQSNIINQFYSFFSCRQKSQRIALRAIQATCPKTQFQEKILLLFYNTIRAINAKRGRKYVNRAMMLNYFTPEMIMENLPQVKEKIETLDFISLEDLCQIFRRCCQAFLKIVSIPAILTSKRITGISKEQHFKKRRKILKAITGY